MTLQLQSSHSLPLPVISRSLTRSRSPRDSSCPCRSSLNIERLFALDPVSERMFVVEKRRSVAKLWSVTLDGCRCQLLLDTTAAGSSHLVQALPPDSITADLDKVMWKKGGDLYELSKRLPGNVTRRENALPDTKLIVAYGKHLQPMPGTSNAGSACQWLPFVKKLIPQCTPLSRKAEFHVLPIM